MGKREDFIVFIFPLHILSLHSKSTLCVVCFFLIYLFFNRLCPGSGRFLKCVATAMKSSYFFRLKFDSFMALRPGEGPRALRLALWPFPGAPSHSTLTLFICAKPWRASIPVGPCRGRKNVSCASYCIKWQ